MKFGKFFVGIGILVVALSYGALGQQWPFCESGCNANDVLVQRIYLANMHSVGGVYYVDVYADFSVTAANRYCVMVAAAFSSSASCSDLVTVWRMFGDLSQGTYNNQYIGSVAVNTRDLWVCRLYAIWRNQDSPDCHTGCDLYSVGSKCWDSTITPYALRGLDAVDDYYTASMNTPLNILSPGVLQNDYYPDGVSQLFLVSQPLYGTVTLNSDGSFTYTPPANWSGTDYFVYRLTDTKGFTDTATVYITVYPAQADLLLEKTVDKATPNVGTNVVFTVTVTNQGPSEARDVEVTDVLPAGYSYVSHVASVGTYASATGEWVIGTLARDAVATLAITAKVEASGPYTNTATVSATTADPNPGNNSASASTTPVAQADLLLEKTVDKATPNVGTNVVFTVTVTNQGPSEARDVEVTDVLPAGYSYVSHVASVGTYASATGEWVIGTLARDAVATLAITAKVEASGPYTNTATVSATTADPNPGNNSASASTTPVAQADLRISKFDRPDPVVAGQSLAYTLVVTNNGPSDAQNVVVTEAYPADFAFGSATPAPDAGTNNQWTFSLLPAGESRTITILGMVAPGASGVIKNTTSVSSATPDFSLANNYAVVLTEVDAIVVAENDEYTANEDTPLTVPSPGVLGNDAYPDGFGSLSVVSNPAHGSLTLNPDGSFTYIPESDWHDNDFFVYRLCDLDGDCDEATVTITVNSVNDVPQALSQNLRTCKNTPVTFNLLAIDPDTDPNNPEQHPLRFDILGGPEKGILSGNFAAITYSTPHQALLRVTYTPALDFLGTDTITFEVWDPVGFFAIGTVTIIVESCGKEVVGGGAEAYAPVVINEIAWAGTPASPEDQWIELLNVTDQPIDLTGWVLRWRRKFPTTPEEAEWKVVELRGVIPAQGYFLLERGHDDVVSDIPADLIYDTAPPYNLKFSPFGDIVELLDASGNVVDTANADRPERDGWIAGSAAPFLATMERIDPYDRDREENWATNRGIIINGLDAKKGLLIATARYVNEELVARALAAQPAVPAVLGKTLTITLQLPSWAQPIGELPKLLVAQVDWTGKLLKVLPPEEIGEALQSRRLPGLLNYELRVDTGKLGEGVFQIWIIMGKGLVHLLTVDIRPVS